MSNEIDERHEALATDCESTAEAMCYFDCHEAILLRRAATTLRQLQAENAALVEALQGIAEFGKRHPGHGYSCATLASQALALPIKETPDGTD